MTSGLLYLAIVGVWAVVLVPMWVRRSDAGDLREGESADVPPASWGQGRARARVVARRRRRLAGIATLFVVTVIIAATGLAPWWIIPVPGLALVGFLACLRAAAACDAELAERDRLRAEELAGEHEPAEHFAASSRSDSAPHRASAESAAEGVHGSADSVHGSADSVHGSADSVHGSADTGAAEPHAHPEVTESTSLDSRVIDFPTGSARSSGRTGARDELFDQYAELPRRAAGD